MGDRYGQWHIEYRRGDFGTDYLSRAAAACAPVRAEIPDDALPALTRTDAEGRALERAAPLSAALRPDVAPPVYASWALSTHPTIEDRSISLGDGDGLTLDEDGSLPIPSSTTGRNARAGRTGCRRPAVTSRSCCASSGRVRKP